METGVPHLCQGVKEVKQGEQPLHLLSAKFLKVSMMYWWYFVVWVGCIKCTGNVCGNDFFRRPGGFTTSRWSYIQRVLNFIPVQISLQIFLLFGISSETKVKIWKCLPPPPPLIVRQMLKCMFSLLTAIILSSYHSRWDLPCGTYSVWGADVSLFILLAQFPF